MNVQTKPRAFVSVDKAALPPVVLTKKQKLLIAVAALDAKGSGAYLSTIRDVDGMSETDLDQIGIKGTLLEPVAAALAAHGAPTNETAGGVLRALEITPDDLHNVVCFCMHNSEVMLAHTARDGFDELADKC